MFTTPDMIPPCGAGPKSRQKVTGYPHTGHATVAPKAHLAWRGGTAACRPLVGETTDDFPPLANFSAPSGTVQASQRGWFSGQLQIGSSMSCSQSALHTAAPLHGSGPFTVSGQVSSASLQPRTLLSPGLLFGICSQFGYQLVSGDQVSSRPLR